MLAGGARDATECPGKVHVAGLLAADAGQERAMRQGSSIAGADGGKLAARELGARAPLHLPDFQVSMIRCGASLGGIYARQCRSPEGEIISCRRNRASMSSLLICSIMRIK